VITQDDRYDYIKAPVSACIRCGGISGWHRRGMPVMVEHKVMAAQRMFFYSFSPSAT